MNVDERFSFTHTHKGCCNHIGKNNCLINLPQSNNDVLKATTDSCRLNLPRIPGEGRINESYFEHCAWASFKLDIVLIVFVLNNI